MNNTPPETEEVLFDQISCSGSSDKLGDGHPKVWLRVSPKLGWVQCPYCEKRFVKKNKPFIK